MQPPNSPPADRRLRILLCGYGHLGLALLQGLLECADICEVVGVFRWSSRPDSANCWEPVEGTLQQMVANHGLRDIRGPGVNAFEFTALLRELKPDVLLVGAWGEILKPHLLNTPGMLFINCHPSKLPAHRGANPYASVIRARERETGVTFHKIIPKIDAGAILLQESVPLIEHDTGASIRDKCTIVAYQMTRELIPRLHAHIVHQAPLEETAQDVALKSYFPPLKPEDGLIDWYLPPEELYCRYRALYPWIASYAHLSGGRTVFFFDPRFIERPGHLPADEAPGTILANQRGTLTTALADPRYVLETSHYRISRKNGYWPITWSRLLSFLMLRPGVRFSAPTGTGKREN